MLENNAEIYNPFKTKNQKPKLVLDISNTPICLYASLKTMKRIIIYPAEVAIILGKSESYSQKLIKSIKDAYGKKKHQPVSIRLFCDFMDLPYEEVFNMVNGIKDQSA